MATEKIRQALSRYVRQREELGEHGWVLGNLTRKEVLSLASARTDQVATEPAVGVTRPGLPEEPRESIGPEVDRSKAVTSERRVESIQKLEVTMSSEAPSVDVDGLGYDDLRDEALACRRCRLCDGRTQAVFSDGNPDARLMVVGEAPGQREDESGFPFVGPAGKLLDLLLASVDLSRKESVYICNVIKCRPPGNRNPLPDEIAACAPFLRRQIQLVSPEVILAVGTFAAQLLVGRETALGKLRGEVYSYEGVPLVVTYHPAALLRNSGWTRATWTDFQLLREVMERSD